MWCTPAPPRPSGSSIRKTKLLVPSGVPVHENCGETFSPTQLALLPEVLALAAFLGSMVPSLKVDEVRLNTSAADAGTQNDTSARALVSTNARFNMVSLPLGCWIEGRQTRAGRSVAPAPVRSRWQTPKSLAALCVVLAKAGTPVGQWPLCSPLALPDTRCPLSRA